VTSVASSSQSGVPGYPRVTAALNTKATVMPSEMRVIIPGKRSLSSRAAPCRNTRPPYAKTAVPKTGAIHDPPGPTAWRPVRRANMWPHTIVGIVSAREIQNFLRNISTLWPACLSWPP
jgi:hypothetical protein